MAKQVSPVRMAAGKTAGKQNTKKTTPRIEARIKNQAKIQKALYEIAAAASAVADMQEFYATMHRIVGKLMYAKSFYISLYDPAAQLISSPYFADESGDTAPAPTRIDSSNNKSLRAHVLLKGKTLHVSRDEIERGRRRGRFTPRGTPAQDWIGVPLKMNGQVIGSLTVQSYKKGIQYEEQDVKLLEFVAQHIAVALTRAQAIEKTRQLNTELQIINSVQESLVSKLDLQSIYELVGDKVRATFHNMDISIRIYDAKTGLLHYRYVYENGQRITIDPFPYPQRGFGPHVLRTGETLLINENMQEEMEKYGSGIIPGTLVSKSLLMVPLITGTDAPGLITVSDVNREHAFSDSDVRLLQTLASSMSVALENARLWEQEKLYRKALERELEIGREIQAGFLPEELPQAEGWEIAAALLSAREVAGDFYDVFEFPDGTLGLVVADVCDKGVGAALFMTLFRSLIRAAANLDHFQQTRHDPAAPSAAERLQRAMSLTNNYIAETHGESGMFATVFFGILDPRDGRLIYINGGHEPPLILRPGQVLRILPKTGPALGAIANCRFDLCETQLQESDTLFAFTDGVPDCRNPKGEVYGRERLFDILQIDPGPAGELIKTIKNKLRHFMGGATQYDDITLLALRCR